MNTKLLKKGLALLLSLAMTSAATVTGWAAGEDTATEGTTLIDIDFADYYDSTEGAENVYTIAQLREKGMKIQGDNDNIRVAITEDGIGEFYNASTTQHQENRIWFDAMAGKTSGYFEFDVVYKATNCTYTGDYARAATRKIFTLNNKYQYSNWGDDSGYTRSPNVLVMNKNASTYGLGPGSGVNDNSNPIQTMIQASGQPAKWCYNTARGDAGGTDIYDLKIVVESESGSTDWTVNVYDNEIESKPLVTSWTSERAEVADLTKLGMKWRGTKSNNNVVIQVLSWKAVEKPLATDNEILNIDFSEYYDATEGATNVYTIAQLRELGMPINGDNDTIKVAITEDGVAEFYSDSTSNQQQNRVWFDGTAGLSSGCYEFDVVYKATNCTYNGDYARDATRKIFTLNNKYEFNNWGRDDGWTETPNVLVFNKLAESYGVGPGSGNNGSRTDVSVYKQRIGTGYYPWIYDAHRDTNIYNLKIIVASASATDDWTVNVYDNAVSTTNSISNWTVKRKEAPDLTKLGMKWRGNKESFDVEIQTLSWKAVKKSMCIEETSLDGGIRTAQPSATVTFGVEIDENSLNGITFTTKSGVDMVYKKELSEDGRTVILYMDELTNGTEYVLKTTGNLVSTLGIPAEAETISVKANAALNTLYDINFADYYSAGANKYTTAQLIEKGLPLAENEITSYEISENGTAKLVHSGTPDGSAYYELSMKTMLPTPVLKGCVTFDFSFDRFNPNAYGGCAPGGANYRIFRINDQPLLSVCNAGWPGGAAGSVVSDIAGVNFINGAISTDSTPLSYYPAPEGNVYDLRVTAYRNSENSDWTIKVFDKSVSIEMPILRTTISKELLPSISYVRSAHGSQNTSGTANMNMKTTKAYIRNLPENVPAISEWKVTDTEGNIIKSNLTGYTAFDCTAYFEELGGTFYVAVYEGDKLVEVKSATPEEIDYKTINFTGMTTSVATRVVGFYWTDDMVSITDNSIDMLN